MRGAGAGGPRAAVGRVHAHPGPGSIVCARGGAIRGVRAYARTLTLSATGRDGDSARRAMGLPPL